MTTTINNEHKKLNVPNSTDRGNVIRNVPALRFPEFSGEWKREILNDVCTFHNGRAYKQNELLSDGKYRVLRVGNFFTNDSWYYSDLELDDEKVAVNGDLLYAWSASFGPRFWTGEKVIYHYHIWKIDSFQQVSKEFLFYFLERDTEKIKNEVQGGTMVHITKGDMEKREILYPSILEQSKIARLLSLLDERIATQNKIIEDLKKLKSAIIEKLYSDIQGKEYSYRQLFEVINERNKQMEYSNILAASQEKGMVNRDELNLDIQFERSNIDIYKIVRKGDYVIHLRSFQGGFAFSNMTGVCSPAYTILRPSTLLEYGYLSYYFKSYRFIKSLIIVTYGIRDGRSISVEEWLNLKISIPSKEHQLHILKVLRSFDLKIENEETYASCLSNQKQYLLRQMFI